MKANLFAASAVSLLVATVAQAADSAPILIGVPVGLFGAHSVVAPSVVQEAQLAVDEINAAGGVLGRKLQLEVADDASGAAGAQKAFDSLIYQKKVGCADLDGDKRGAKRRASRRQQGSCPLHLHVLLRALVRTGRARHNFGEWALAGKG